MRARWVLAALLVSGCNPEVSDGDDDVTATPTPTGTPEAGTHITSNTTWSGAYSVTDNTIVDAGVTLTISSGSTITVASGMQLRVDGHLDVQGYVLGTASTPTLFQPASGTWNGITVRSGGTATIRNVDLRSSGFGIRTESGAGLTKVISAKMTSVSSPISFAGGGKACRVRLDATDGPVSISGGDVVLSDGDYREGSGDRVVFSGNGSLTIDHIIVGGTAEHCLIHGSNSTLLVTKSIFLNGAIAFMVTGLTNAELHFNKIELGNLTEDISTGTSTVDATENYWGGATYTGPALAGWDVTNPVPNATDARVVDAGPRAWGAGCEADAQF